MDVQSTHGARGHEGSGLGLGLGLGLGSGSGLGLGYRRIVPMNVQIAYRGRGHEGGP